MKILRKAGILALVVAGCASTQTTGSASQPDLEARANSTLGEMIARDPGLADVVHDSYAYAVFPEIGKAGAPLRRVLLCWRAGRAATLAVTAHGLPPRRGRPWPVLIRPAVVVVQLRAGNTLLTLM